MKTNQNKKAKLVVFPSLTGYQSGVNGDGDYLNKFLLDSWLYIQKYE